MLSVGSVGSVLRLSPSSSRSRGVNCPRPPELFLLGPFFLLRVPSLSPQVLSFFPQTSQPSLLRGLSVSLMAVLNRRLWQLSRRSSPPGPRVLSSRVCLFFQRRFR